MSLIYRLKYLLLLPLVILSFYLLYKNHYAGATKVTDNLLYADAYSKQFIVEKMDALGHLHSRLASKIAVHYRYHNLTNFVEPHIIIYRQPQSPWIFTAEYGQAINGSDQITLLDNVTISQAKSKHNQPLTIKTQSITYYPKRQFANTLWPVTLTRPQTIIHAVGLNAYIDKKILVLTSKVSGIFTPNAKTT